MVVFLNVLALGVADFAARVAAVTSKRELTLAEVVHAQVEELDVEGAATGGDGVYSEIHIAVRGKFVVANR